MANDMSKRTRFRSPLPSDYMLLILSAVALLLGVVLFSLVPAELAIRDYRAPALAFLAALVVTAIGNIVVNLVQRGVSREAAKALSEPIDELTRAVEQINQIQDFVRAGLVGVYANRVSAMERFRSEIEREDQKIEFVGTSLLGTLDPTRESEAKSSLQELLLQKRLAGVRIRALLMHPAYGEFRERVENRERAAVARDIQATLGYLIDQPRTTSEADEVDRLTDSQKLWGKQDVRLYPGVITAMAILTSRSMLVNASSLHGPVYENFTLIIEDTGDPNSIFKQFRRNHFEQPWQSEKTVRLDEDDEGVLQQLLNLDFADDANRFKEGGWPATIPTRAVEPSRGAANSSANR